MAEYNREYRKANREKIAEYKREYRENHKESEKERARKWREANRDKIAESNRKYRSANRKKIAEHKHKWYEANKDAEMERVRRWQKANPEKVSEYNRKWYESNREKAAKNHRKWREANPKYLCEYQHKRITEDIQYRLARNLRGRLRSAINGSAKNGSAVRDLGCTIEELKAQLESQFTGGMTWDNYGDWHIDHIEPLSSFDLTDRKQLLQACHYTNLQPLWAKDNISKGNKSH